MHKLLLSTPLFSVEHREYQRTGRGPVDRDVVVHPGAVVILPLLDAKTIVLIRSYRWAVERELLELPAGTREPDETALETAARELEEETGYRAESLTPFLEFYPSPGVLTERMHVFVARELSFVGQRLTETEEIRTERVSFDEARAMVVRGAFEDGKTIATLATFFLRDGR